jgi:AAHS family 4-hydroxybenzoate transporter-like MFS transporter
MTSASTVDLGILLDEQPVRPMHVAVILLCAAAMFSDGFDVQLMGYIAPAIIHAWGLKREALGPAFGAGLAGLMVGTLLWSPIADRIGRKPVILGSLAVFGLLSLATTLAHDLQTLAVLRFLTGLGLGGVMPNAVAMTSEYAPKKFRTTFVILMWFGFTLGSGFGGGIAAALSKAYGWQAAFIFGGALPLALIPILMLALPESVRVLASAGRSSARIAAILKRLDRQAGFAPDTRFVLADEKPKPAVLSGLTGLFAERRTVITLLLWVMFFANLLELYFLGNWMPTLMTDAGLPPTTAILATSMIHFGAIFGSLILGAISDRLNVFWVMTVSYLLSGVFTAAIGHAGASTILAVTFGFGAGFFITGNQNCANALAARLYPTASRATGIGWALGIGRLGSIAGPVVAGLLLAGGWSIQSVFLAAGLPSLLAAASVLALGRAVSRRNEIHETASSATRLTA